MHPCLSAALVLFFSISFIPGYTIVDPLLSSGKHLERIRDELQFAPPFLDIVAYSIAAANQFLDLPCYSVMEKTTFPPSQNKHDYLSLARYWWPDDQKGGIPYVRRDGLVNPEIESDAYDYNKKCTMTDAVKMLCLAYFFSRDEHYAEKAAEKIRAWFLDPSSRMNPHLKFAQGIPGKVFGRPAGIIESSPFPALFDVILLLEGSNFWSVEDQKNLEGWIAEYLHWLITSPYGACEGQAPNNHGSWYDFQVIYFSLYIHQNDLAKTHLIKRVLPRLKSQFTPCGAQPHELERSKSFFYCIYNMQALYWCAVMGERLGIDIWEKNLGEEATLRKSLNWLLPYALGCKPWVNADIEPIDPKQLSLLLLIGAEAYRESSFLSTYYRIMDKETTADIFRLFYPGCFFDAQRGEIL